MMKILLPAGSLKSLAAALDTKAHAVYLGVGDLNARKGAKNIGLSDIGAVIDMVHKAQKEIFITLNVIFFEEELEYVKKMLLVLLSSEIDGLIIQDLSVFNLIKELGFKTDRIILSTQANINNKYSVRLAKKLGVKKVILARELTIEEINEITEDTDIETEIFVHGAICYSYSGLCYMSSLIGTRSGNRGECAQPCRLRYRYDRKSGYFLSTRDLCLYEDLGKLEKVDYLKIEGRLKSEHYVNTCGKVYTEEAPDYLLDLVFNRDYCKGHLYGKGADRIINAWDGIKRGALLGYAKAKGDFYSVSLKYDLALGDGVYIEERKEGVRLKAIYDKNGKFLKKARMGETVLLKLGLKDYIPKVTLYLNNSHQTIWHGKTKLPTRMPVVSFETEMIFDNSGLKVIYKGKEFCFNLDYQKAQNRPLSEEFLKDVMTKSADSIFCFKDPKIKLEIEEKFLPMKDLNNVRNLALEKLIESETVLKEEKTRQLPNNPEVRVMVDRVRKYEVLKNHYKNTFYLPVEDIKKFYDDVIPYFPPVLDSEFYDYMVEAKRIKGLGYKKVLVGDLGGINICKEIKLEFLADNYFNCVNHLSVNFLRELGADSVCLSQEVPTDNISEIVKKTDVDIEIMVKGRRNAMISANCVEYSAGKCTSRDNCRGGYILQDMDGKEFPVVKKGCKNFFFSNNITDIRSKNIKAHIYRYDFRGMTIPEVLL